MNVQKGVVMINLLGYVLGSEEKSMRLREYINQLEPTALQDYAHRCSIALSYLRLHVKYASKNPSVSLIKALARESKGRVSLAEVLEHYGITDDSVPSEVA